MRLLSSFVTCCAMALAGCTDAPADSVLAGKVDFQTAQCERATVEDLWNNPWPYLEKRVCVTGYLGRMVPYGEDSADLFATGEDAKTRQSTHYLTISVHLTIKAQEQLAAHSEEKFDAVGTFHFDARCWPQQGEKESRFQCFPPRPMNLLSPTVALAR